MVGLTELLEEGEPLMRFAMDAVLRYHEARDSAASCEEVERLRDDAEVLMRELRDFQVEIISMIDQFAH